MDFFSEHHAIQTAYESRALDLLRSPFSQTYIALFRSAFPDKTESRYEDDLLSIIDDSMRWRRCSSGSCRSQTASLPDATGSRVI